MNRIEYLIQKMRAEWSIPRFTTAEGDEGSFKLVCVIADRKVEAETSFGFDIPIDLGILWSIVEHADLFKDVEYGQWGLSLYSAEEAFEATKMALRSRNKDFRATDIVIGSFYGDSDLLCVCCDKGEAFGTVVVALPIDPREEWYPVSDGLVTFLEKYVAAEGDKFWER
jgi:hypothetical protein